MTVDHHMLRQRQFAKTGISRHLPSSYGYFAAVTLIGGAGCHVQGGSHHQVSAVQAEGLWEGTVFTMLSVTTLPLERLLCFAGSYAKTWWASAWWQNLPCCCATKASSTNIPEGGSSLKTFFLEMSAAQQFVLVPKVSRLRKGGKKRNGATIFTGARVFKAWSCLRRCPIRWDV